ncbi:MAG: hypothetical protein WA970_02155, partial [Gammaproteobacteria bacterium]
QAQHVTLSRQTREAAQLPLDLPAAPSPPTPQPAEDVPPFQAAERSGEYHTVRPVTVDEVFAFVRQELERQFFRQDILTCPEDTKRYLIAELAREEREVFACLFLDLCVALRNVELSRRGRTSAWIGQPQLHISGITIVASN